jgi:regulatory protein
MLGRRSQSARGLREKLLRKFSEKSGGEIEDVIARFCELGLLDDMAYAETFARDRFLRAGYGRRRIEQDLERKGVASADIRAVLDRVVDESTERQMAECALERFRARRAHVKDPQKTREASFRHLIGRGFSVALVRDLLAVS